MKLSILTLMLAVSSCCSDEELTSLNAVRPSTTVVKAENPRLANTVIDSKEKPVGDASSVKNEVTIANLRKYLGEVQAELKTYPEFPKFHCRIGAEPIPDEYVMTEKEKESYRQAGFDPDAIAKNANELMEAERAREKRWKELNQTEEDLQFLLKIYTAQSGPR